MKSTGVDESDREEYRGKYLGKLNAYHHQVAGDVYVVDEYTLLLTSFSYDGNGADTFFWAGASNRPGPQGFIVPDEWGKSVYFVIKYILRGTKPLKGTFCFRTNVLDRYLNKDFTLTLPDNKRITDIKWFAVYDLGSQVLYDNCNENIVKYSEINEKYTFKCEKN